MGNVKLDEKVIVVGKKGAKHLEEGKEYEIHPLHAATLLKNGEAEKPKDKK